jgi:hypothetical protein
MQPYDTSKQACCDGGVVRDTPGCFVFTVAHSSDDVPVRLSSGRGPIISTPGAQTLVSSGRLPPAPSPPLPTVIDAVCTRVQSSCVPE